MTEQPTPPKCPHCGFFVFTRRYPKCEKCGQPLPVGMVLSKEDLDQLLARERAENEALHRQNMERDSRRSDTWFDFGNYYVDLGGGSSGGDF